jgi:hypothetical protein
MPIDLKRKLFLPLALTALTVQAEIPTDLNLCLDAWHSCDKELVISKEQTDTWKKLADKALIQRNAALETAAHESNPNFLGIPPLGWGFIGLATGVGATFALGGGK